MIQQNNTVENSLTINITEAEAREIELQARPCRERVQAMFAAYRPMAGSSEQSNGEQNILEVEASPVPDADPDKPK